MVTLIITYYPLGNKRYLRNLSVDDYSKNWFVNHYLNLGFIKIKKKDDLVKDFEMCKLAIGKEIHLHYTPERGNEN